MALSDLFRAVAALFARAPAPLPAAPGGSAPEVPPAAPMQASRPETQAQYGGRPPAVPGDTDWLALCRPLSQHFESCYLTAYPDPASPLGKALQARGIWYRTLAGAPIPADPVLRALSGAPWTCGWGSTGPDVREGTTWTQATADARHDENLEAAASLVDRAVTVVLAPHEKAAMVSIVNNVGAGRARTPSDPGRDGIVVLASGAPSTLLRMLNAGDRAGAAAQFLAWNRAGGVVSAGLVRRRAAERDLFLTGKWSPA
ncbi:lysozyme [Burkholderia plantarii]|uniref:lysozyme n=1 Tax=Burkholderia plantarii TaxID=41899 RepID=UPI00272AD8BC|nr:lysozyme [Burkholderia plantarii]WLE58401.1 lysozyme [Burkholderia plantarii]